MKLTKFQTLFILWLRHNKYQDCSWRALAGNFYARYTKTLRNKKRKEHYKGWGGNQMDGMIMEEAAFRELYPNPLFKQPVDLYDADLTLVDEKFNIKNYE